MPSFDISYLSLVHNTRIKKEYLIASSICMYVCMYVRVYAYAHSMIVDITD